MATDDFFGAFTPPRREPAAEMTGLAAEIAARFKEIFYQYTSRQARSTQSHLGPSEIGTPCDRRIAMSLMRVPPCNPGGDNWASFAGIQIHAGLADMLVWSSGNTGRYAVEQSLTLPSPHVPKGTTDLIDRILLMVGDHKNMGSSSLSRLRREGPSQTHRVQLHTYGYGAELAGERIEHVAIIAWPREAASLKGLHVWTEPYDRQVALDALARVDRIADEVRENLGWHDPPHVAKEFPVADDCRFCPFHMPGATSLERGCNGNR